MKGQPEKKKTSSAATMLKRSSKLSGTKTAEQGSRKHTCLTKKPKNEEIRSGYGNGTERI